METIIQTTKWGTYHPALGFIIHLTLSNGKHYKIYAEWFFHLFDDWKGDPESLVGKEVSEEWCEANEEK